MTEQPSRADRPDRARDRSSRSSRSTRRASASSWARSPTWTTMEKARRRCSRTRGIRYEIRVMSAHRDPDIVADYCQQRPHARAAGDHRRRRPVGRAARASSPRTPTCRSSACRCPVACRRPAGSTRCSRSSRCRPACRSPASAWTTRATRRPRRAHPRRRGGWRLRARDRPLHPPRARRPSGPTRPAWRAGAQVEVAAREEIRAGPTPGSDLEAIRARDVHRRGRRSSASG